MNVEQRLQALEALLEKVKTNAAKPRPGRASVGRVTDDVAGPAIAAAPVRVPAPTASKAEDYGDTAETFDTPVPLAAPLPGPAKDAQKAPAAAATAAAKPGAGKITMPIPAIKAADAPAKPAVATPAAGAAKPVVTPAVKPVVTPAVKPVITPAKPTTPANAPIPLTNKVAAPIIKTPAVPVAVKQADPLANISKTLTGVGDGAVKAPGGSEADAFGSDLEKKIPPAKTSEPSLPSAAVDSDDIEEPTQLYEPSAASRRASELAQLAEKQLEEAKKALGVDKKAEGDKVDVRLPEAKPAAEAKPVEAKPAEAKPAAEKPQPIEVKIDPPPKLDLADKKAEPEKKPEPEKVETAAAEDKVPAKKGPSQTELDLEAVASQPDVEKVEVDVSEPKKAEAKPKPEPELKAEAKPEAKPTPPAVVPPVVEDKPAAKPEPAPISEKKPIVEKKAAPVSKPVIVEAEPMPPTTSKGVPKLLIVAAVILVLAAGAFVAMQQGWIGGAPTSPTPTVAPPTNTPNVAPTPTATAQPPATTDTAAPAASASAAPADSAAAPAVSASAAPADSAAPPTDSAAPAASASAAPTTAPATPGTPSVDPATLNNNQGLVFVTSNKAARVYMTGKMVGQTNTELTVECGLKFVRLADPTIDITKPPVWLTEGKPQQIDCRKYTTFAVNVP